MWATAVLLTVPRAAAYSVRVSMDRIEKEDYNLNISRYVSTAVA
jgi:type I restriction-modification system DNA methylase subunit